MDRISFGISQTCWHDQTLVIVLFFSIHSSPSASRNWLRGTVLERFPLGLEDKPSFGWRENKSVSIILESLETHCSFSCIPSWIPDVFYGPSFFSISWCRGAVFLPHWGFPDSVSLFRTALACVMYSKTVGDLVCLCLEPLICPSVFSILLVHVTFT